MEDLFVLGENDKFSLQEMIERDINSGYPDQSLSEDFLVSDPLEIANLSPHSFSPHVSTDLVNQDSNSVIDLKSLNNSVVWYANGVLNISELQNGNINPNLLVNPQTGLPVSNQSEETSTEQPLTISVSPVEVVPDDVLQSPDSEMMSPGQSPYVSEISRSIPVTQSSSVQYVTTQQQPTLCSIQNSNAIFRHQTLTQHLLSNNNHHKLLHKDPNEKVFPKPVYSYSCLIAMALKNSETGALPVSEIYSFMTENFPYFKTAPDGWKNSVRHNLSLNKCFEKIENPRANGNTRKGCLWGLNPNKIEKMEEEIVKWRKKDPAAVKKSMSKPEKLEELERGNIGSHAPLPAGLKALRELQLMRLNNIHAAGNTGHIGSVTLNSSGNLALSTMNSPTVTMVTPIYSDNRQTAVTQTVVARTLAQQLISTNVIASQAQQSPPTTESEKQGGVQVTMVEVVPQNKVQQIKSEPVYENTAERKPIVINIRNDVPVKKEEIKKEEVDDFSLLDGSLNLDPSLSDFALQHLDELANEGINLDELPASLNLSFSSSPSPSTVQGVLNPHRTSSPLVGFLQSNGGSLSASRTVSALT